MVDSEPVVFDDSYSLRDNPESVVLRTVGEKEGNVCLIESIWSWLTSQPILWYCNKDNFSTNNWFKSLNRSSFLSLRLFEWFGISPNAAGIVFRPSDNGITLVVKLAWEDFVLVAFQSLQAFSWLYVPEASSMVETCREDLGALRVENSLGNFSLVSFKNSCARECWNIVQPHGWIHTGCD